ncbi:hypothetical protein UFOVP1298_12 [uncultured Caudovirales phage]|uniref:Uncharacterized protein n=1 Tax=uncultured Caudovirales phage TaxID=2100421 RepID=A0A6J5RSI7_9CAUD|nr:hypothetical protein UFOVP1298_12 [uncultured Caudovirales phage]
MKRQDRYFEYLDALHQCGLNGFGAIVYLEYAFDLSRREAGDVLMKWIKKRNPQGAKQ